ncbi:Peptidoglycan recognition protein-lc [Operophtera brumata]|uniref:Peptidoglycan recognition protein-lc n=1 Tax=Operophtera brumata TaxID=104452 RepID=A0A0L7KSP7_OPEBR|nr:Peptidoglycan recognition protein-lc [Operophtera brumata]
MLFSARFLGLEMISVKSTLRCSIAVCVCWTFVVAFGLAFYLFRYTLPRLQTRLDLGLKEEWFFRRVEWQAMPPYDINFLSLPVSNVLIGHSATPYCDERYICIENVMDIQAEHLRRGWDDIGPNYLVSGNGLVFEGRGANVQGAMVRSWNIKSITIMFLGDYSKNKTRPEQFEHVNILLTELVKHRVLSKDYVLMGHCQVSPFIITPGKNIMDKLDNFKHWNPVNKTYYLSLPCYLWTIIKSTSRVERLWCVAGFSVVVLCLTLIIIFTRGTVWNITREMWLAAKNETTETTTAFEPLRLVVIQHTVSNECHVFKLCAAEVRNLQAWNLRDCPCDIAPYNRCALGLGFIGDYRDEMPRHASVTELQINRTMMLFEYGVQAGYLHPDYQVVGAKDLQKSSASPGSNLYNAIRKWEHYTNGTAFIGKTCDQIYAEFKDG